MHKMRYMPTIISVKVVSRLEISNKVTKCAFNSASLFNIHRYDSSIISVKMEKR